MFDDLFKMESATIDEKKFGNRTYMKTPVMYETGPDFDTVILLEAPISREHLRGLKNILKSNNIPSYRILSCLPFYPHDKDIEKDIVNFYRNVSIKLKDYIPEGVNVLAIGRANYAILRDDDLNIDGFRDNLLWKTTYFSPELNATIYPIDGFYQWYQKDNFEYYWLRKQLKFIARKPGKKIRLPSIKEVIVENPTEWLRERASGTDRTAIDLETNTLDAWKRSARVGDLTLSLDGKTGYYLDFAEVDLDVLSEFLEGRPLVGSNLKFDIKFLHQVGGIPLRNMRIAADTMHLQHLINEMQRKGLKSGAWMWSRHGGYDWAMEDYKRQHPYPQRFVYLMLSRTPACHGKSMIR